MSRFGSGLSSCFAFAATALSSCASYHVVPSQNYSATDTVEPRVIRIAFDQDGNIYPFSPNEFGLKLPERIKTNNSALVLPFFYAGKTPGYDVEALTSVAISKVNTALAASPNARLVILIHGFNNDYADSDAQFEAVRSEIASADADARHVYLQVYWDGLYKGDGTAPAPLNYFAKALTYSELAGMCGLRRVVSALPQGTGVTFVTHSRGAAVALTTAIDPAIATNTRFRKCATPARPIPSQRGEMALVAYAPAVGYGPLPRARAAIQAHYDYFDKLYLGVNRNDPATNKKALGVKVGCRRGGDTCLGADPEYAAALAAVSNDHLQYVNFSQPYHGWKTYLADQPNSRCLLWAGRLIASKPSGCGLTR